MSEIEIIRKRYNAWFNDNKKDIINKEKEINKLIDIFLKKYTQTRILNMEIDDYVEGKSNYDSFCYWIENKLKEAGDIHGATAYKFGIFYSKKNKKYEVQVPKYNSNYNLALDEIKKEIINVINASNMHDIDAIANSKLSNMFKNKISYLYNRYDYLPIYSDDDIKKLLIIFELSHGIKHESIERKKDRLFRFYKQLNLPSCSPWRFMHFIYNPDGYRHELRDEDVNDFLKANSSKLAIYTMNNIEDLFVDRDYSGRKSVYKTDLDKEKSNKLAGEKGEDRVIEYFEANKKKLDIIDIKYYCKQHSPDANDLAGCDIEYITSDGKHWFVEVKSTKSNHIEKQLFYMSDIEYNKMKENVDNYYILYFNNVYKGNVVKLIPARLILGKEHPVKYTFNLQEIKEKNNNI